MCDLTKVEKIIVATLRIPVYSEWSNNIYVNHFRRDNFKRYLKFKHMYTICLHLVKTNN